MMNKEFQINHPMATYVILVPLLLQLLHVVPKLAKNLKQLIYGASLYKAIQTWSSKLNWLIA